MRNDSVKSPDDEKTSWPQPETDYAPKKYTRKEKILLGVKFVAAAGIFYLLMSLFKYFIHNLHN
jgi:hypothetical protein